MYHLNMITVNYNLTESSITQVKKKNPLVMFLRDFVNDSMQSHQNSNVILLKTRKKQFEILYETKAGNSQNDPQENIYMLEYLL